jgi:hypothetical protein
VKPPLLSPFGARASRPHCETRTVKDAGGTPALPVRERLSGLGDDRLVRMAQIAAAIATAHEIDGGGGLL